MSRKLKLLRLRAISEEGSGNFQNEDKSNSTLDLKRKVHGVRNNRGFIDFILEFQACRWVSRSHYMY